MPSETKLSALLAPLSAAEQRQLFDYLQQQFGAHPLEAQIGLRAEAVLSAIQQLKAQGGLTWRMLRGVLAESTYGSNVLSRVEGWTDATPRGDLPYDYKIVDALGTEITIQIKLQRSKGNVPMTARQAKSVFPDTMYVVETQKTRGGTDQAGEQTRPYRFGEFDILAVCMQPSSDKWDDYRYTLGRWLLPDAKDSCLVGKFQPVAVAANTDWTDDLATAIGWFLADGPPVKRIGYSALLL